MGTVIKASQSPVNMYDQSQNMGVMGSNNSDFYKMIPKLSIIGIATQLISDDNLNVQQLATREGIKKLLTKLVVLSGVISILELAFESIPNGIRGGFMYGIHSSKTIGKQLLRLIDFNFTMNEQRLVHNAIIFEELANSLTKQQVVSAVMIRNLRVADGEESVDMNEIEWQQYVDFVCHRLGHIMAYLGEAQAYYDVKTVGRTWQHTLLSPLMPEEAPDVLCTITEIRANIDHIMKIVKLAKSQEDLDSNNLKMITNNTKVLFKELRILLFAGRKSDA